MRRSLPNRLWQAFLKFAARLSAVAAFQFRCAGRELVPATGGGLVLSNHQSNLDPVLVGVACPRQLKYLARQGLFFWPFSLWIRSLGAVPIDRERGALAGIRTALELLKQRNAVLVFPEGSRTVTGKLDVMLPGFCLLARRSGATIVPVGIVGAFEALPRGAIYARPHAIRLAFGPPISKQRAAELNDEQLTALVTKRIREAMGLPACESPTGC